METTHELPMLAGIGAILRWAEELVTIGSGPLLTAGLGISLIDLLTDGKLLASAPALLYAWAISQALGVDGQLIGAAVKVGRAFRGNHPWRGVAYIPLIAALGYVAYLASNVFATQQALGISTQDALSRLGMDSTTWIVARSLLAVVLVILSGLLRYEPAKATAIETAEQRAQRYAYELAEAEHKRQLRARTGGAIGSFIAANIQAAKGDDTPGNDDAHTPALDTQMGATIADDTPPDDGGNGGHNTPGNRTRSRRNNPRLHVVPKGMMTREDLQHYALHTHGKKVSNDEALGIIRTLGNKARNGRSYVAPQKAVKDRIDAMYGAGNTDDETQAKGA